MLRKVPRPSPAMVVAVIALVAALGGSAIGKVIISGANIARNAITSAKIKNHSIKAVDIARGVIPVTYTKTEADGRFVNIVPGTINEAPNSAQLGGQDASAFYNKNESDGRFVNKVPGTINEAPNAAQLGGVDASGYTQGGGVTRITRITLDPTSSGPKSDFLTLPGLGTFQVACNSTSTEAQLYFNKQAGVDSVGEITERVYNPPGGGTSDMVDFLTSALITSDTRQFTSATGATALERYVIQLSHTDGTTERVATVTISSTYQDSDIAPGKCFFEGQFVENTE